MPVAEKGEVDVSDIDKSSFHNKIIRYEFKRESVMLGNAVLIVFSSLWGLKEFFEGHFLFSTIIFLSSILWSGIRVFYKARSPIAIEIDKSICKLSIEKDIPYLKQSIDINLIEKVAVHVPLSNFPMVVVQLYLKNKTSKNILFNLQNSSSQFFSLPREDQIPSSVTDFVNTLNGYINDRSN